MMKKLIPFLSFIVLLLVGCSNSTADKVLKASEKMDELDSYTMKYKVEMAGKSGGEDISEALDMLGKVDAKNKISYIEMITEELSMLMYVQGIDDEVTIYMADPLEATRWVKTTVSVEENKGKYESDAKAFLEVIGKATEFKEVTSDVEDMLKYQLTISNKNLISLMEAFGNKFNEEVMQYIKENGSTIIGVYLTEDEYIGRMTIDMKDIFNFPDEGEEISKLLLMVDFKDFNQSAVTIPSDVIENATIYEG